MTTVHFYEIDGGPSGVSWDSYMDNEYLATYHNTDQMIAAARVIHRVGGNYRVYTQEEYNLRWEIEDGQESISA